MTCGWRTIEWVKAVRIIPTYPPPYVLGMFTTRLATKSIAQCLAPRRLLWLLPTSLAIFGPLRPLSVLILALSSGNFQASLRVSPLLLLLRRLDQGIGVLVVGPTTPRTSPLPL